jgi:TonB family protein
MNTPYWFSNLVYWSAQVALLVLTAGFLPHLFKIRQPRVLLIYWRALIAASLLLPFAQPWHRSENLATINFAPRLGEFNPIVISTPAPAVTHWHLPSAQIIAEIIGLIILAGIAARFTILALGLVKLRQFRRASSPISNHSESSVVLDEMRVRVNTGGEFRISSDVESPVTFGLAAPVILLPERFPTLDAQHQSAIACHELLHVRRSDWAHHLSEEILRAALWFHPAIAWLISRIRLSREQVVDLEVVRLTDARKPYLEALLEFTNSRALATAIPAPPFLVERQLAERVFLMLREVRMSRTRLIASLTAIAACLVVVATLAVWTFPLIAAPQISLPPIQSTDKAVVQFVPGGINGGVPGGVTQGVPGGVVVGVTVTGAPNVTITGVPSGIIGGVKNGVPGGITNGQPAPPQSSDQKYLAGGVRVDPIPGSPDHYLIHANPPTPVPAPSRQDDKSAQSVPLVTTKRVAPVYPHEAIANHLEGSVNLTITVNADGKVSDVEFINGTSEFSQAVRDAAYQWEFQPPAKAPAILSARFHFTLSPSRRTPETPSIAAYKDPRAVSSLEVEVVNQDPSPQSAPALTPAESTFFRKFQLIPASASSAQSSSSAIPHAGQNGVTMPICEYCPKPEYSQEARDANIQGTVYLQIVVLTTGRAGEIKVIKGLEESLDKEAIKVVREKWTFRPATDRNGNPIDALVPVDIAFQLYGPPQPTPPNPGRAATASPATTPLTSNETLQTKIFKGSVTDNGASTPFYMGLVNTQTLYSPQPELPRLARQANVHGPVTLNIIVNTEGKVIVVEYVKGPAVLVQEAIKTVRDWIIKGTHDGAPVTFQISVEVGFNGDK